MQSCFPHSFGKVVHKNLYRTKGWAGRPIDFTGNGMLSKCLFGLDLVLIEKAAHDSSYGYNRIPYVLHAYQDKLGRRSDQPLDYKHASKLKAEIIGGDNREECSTIKV
jgi:hypothetical protein